MMDRDELEDVLDICVGWTRTMSDTERLQVIYRIAFTAWLREHDTDGSSVRGEVAPHSSPYPMK